MSDFEITDRFLTDLRAAIDIVEVVSERVPLKKAGKSWKGLCPFHGEKSPSFHVDRDKGLYHCFGCGAGGDGIRFVMESEKVEFPEACERLARAFHVALPPPRGRSATIDPTDKLRTLLGRAQQLFRDGLRGNPDAREYVLSRGIPAEKIDDLGFGWAPDEWARIVTALGPEFGEAALEEAGLAIRHAERNTLYDRFRGRITVPIHDGAGRLIGFGGRVLGAGEPKYLNSPETKLFSKGNVLFNLHRAKPEIRRREAAILVEGYFDVLTLVCGGAPNVVASMGTAMTEAQAELLRRLCPKVVLCYDGDDAGRNAAARSLPILLAKDLEVRVAVLPDGDDPDTLLRRDGLAALETRILTASTPIDFLLSREPDVSSSEGRRGAADRILEVIRAHPDRLVRFSEVEALADRLGVPARLLLERLPRGGAPISGSAGLSSGRAVAAGPARILSGERRLLQILLVNPSRRQAATEFVAAQDFALEEHQAIFSVLTSEKNLTETLDFRELVTDLKSDAAVAALSSITAEDWPDEQSGEFETHMTLLQRKGLERLQEKIQSEISNLARSGEDPERLDSLLHSKLDVKRKIDRLARPAVEG